MKKSYFLFAATLLLCYNYTSAQVFTKVTKGPFVNDSAETIGSTWGDYDNDGDLDLFVSIANPSLNNLNRNNYLYQNNCNGEFTQIIAIPGGVVSDGGISISGTWIDFDNDNDLDLFVSNKIGDNFLYSNNGDGSFEKIITGIIVNDDGFSEGASWADYDNDGFIDLFVANDAGARPKIFNNDFLYRNNGDGTFTKITTDVVVNDSVRSKTGVWGDYNNDGFMDLLVSTGGNLFYHNNGDGSFTKITSGPVVTNISNSWSASWADYDNDLDLDLFVMGAFGKPNALYLNNGDGTFTRIITGDIVTDIVHNNGGNTWGDYDNDGDIDLFLSNFGSNFLYNNNGDGTFTKETNEIVVNDTIVESYSPTWADYDNDGDLDLFVPNAFGAPNNFFYINNGNANHWINIKCKGILSNANAVGARVYIKATINGNDVWQMREINANCSGRPGGTNPFNQHFGFGDATVIDSLKIVWPASGITQIFTSVNPDRHIEITEGVNVIANAIPCRPDLPPKEPAFITGAVLNDIDSNCLFDPFIDFTFSNRMIEVTPGPYFTFSGSSGDYEFIVPEGDDYEIRQVSLLDDVFKELDCPLTDSVYTVSVLKGDTVAGNDFFNVAKMLLPCGPVISIVGTYGGLLTSPCPGQITRYCVAYDNTDKAPINKDTSGFVTFQIDVAPLAAAIVPGSITSNADCSCSPTLSGNTIKCQNPAAYATNKICTICFDVDVPPDPPFITGTIITTTASITGECPGVTPFSGQTSLDDPADCASDPNDKLVVTPEGCGPFGNIERGEALVYRVRFQNVGTAPAFNIVIRDVLDNGLDITTLRILGTSHTLTRLEIIPNNALILTFEDINLPDSLSDPEGSNGFVIFSIKPKDNLTDGTEITNQAGIYFDFNEVVITNTTLNTIRDNPFPIVDFEAKHSCTSAGLVYDFTYTGGTSDSAEFAWDFGQGATPSTSTDENPAGIVYDSAGLKEVTLTIARFGCTSGITKTIEVTSVSCGNINNKILVCHIPPGNPENPQLLCVSQSSLPAHLAHGDCIGPCTIVSSKKSIGYFEETEEQSGNYLTFQNKSEIPVAVFSAFPNPFKQITTITFSLTKPDHLNLVIYNYMGQMVSSLYNDDTDEGRFSVDFNTNDLPAGLFYCVMRTGEEVKVLKLALIR